MQYDKQPTSDVNGYDTNDQTLDARDFLGSAYLSKEDLSGETRLQLVDVRPESVNGATRRKLVARFEGLEKRLILNSTHITFLSKLFGTSKPIHWRGEITLYVDPSVGGGSLCG